MKKNVVPSRPAAFPVVALPTSTPAATVCLRSEYETPSKVTTKDSHLKNKKFPPFVNGSLVVLEKRRGKSEQEGLVREREEEICYRRSYLGLDAQSEEDIQRWY